MTTTYINLTGLKILILNVCTLNQLFNKFWPLTREVSGCTCRTTTCMNNYCYYAACEPEYNAANMCMQCKCTTLRTFIVIRDEKESILRWKSCKRKD